jgi:Hypothetical chloroplast protein Ycf34
MRKNIWDSAVLLSFENSSTKTNSKMVIKLPRPPGRPGRLVALLLLLGIQSTRSFLIFSPGRFGFRMISDRHHHRHHGGQSSSPASSLSMCICIDCARVTNCAAYHFVETKHEQPHMTEDPTFTPRDGSPTIHVNVRTVRKEQDEDVVARMWKEYKAEEKQAELEATAQAVTADTNQQNEDEESMQQQQQQPAQQLHGKTVYDLSSVTTYEYDVVACADFVKDKGCWIRNMPEEIRVANPDFVPT